MSTGLSSKGAFQLCLKKKKKEIHPRSLYVLST